MKLNFLLCLVPVLVIGLQKPAFSQLGGTAPCLRYVGTVNGQIIVESCFAPVVSTVLNNWPETANAIRSGRILYTWSQRYQSYIRLQGAGAGDSQLYRGYTQPRRSM
jgi:hypothetical protein